MPTPEERIAEINPRLVWTGRHCLATDPAVTYAIAQSVDPAQKTELIASTLETTAAIYRTLADGAVKAAQIVSGKSGD
jgi:hypothetical protein